MLQLLNCDILVTLKLRGQKRKFTRLLIRARFIAPVVSFVRIDLTPEQLQLDPHSRRTFESIRGAAMSAKTTEKLERKSHKPVNIFI